MQKRIDGCLPQRNEYEIIAMSISLLFPPCFPPLAFAVVMIILHLLFTFYLLFPCERRFFFNGGCRYLESRVTGGRYMQQYNNLLIMTNETNLLIVNTMNITV